MKRVWSERRETVRRESSGGKRGRFAKLTLERKNGNALLWHRLEEIKAF